jgi:hypothetical protein
MSCGGPSLELFIDMASVGHPMWCASTRTTTEPHSLEYGLWPPSVSRLASPRANPSPNQDLHLV